MGSMSEKCKTVEGLLIGAAGVVFLLFGLGSLAGDTTHIVAGILLLLVGLGRLMHSSNMCPMCKPK